LALDDGVRTIHVAIKNYYKIYKLKCKNIKSLIIMIYLIQLIKRIIRKGVKLGFVFILPPLPRFILPPLLSNTTIPTPQPFIGNTTTPVLAPVFLDCEIGDQFIKS